MGSTEQDPTKAAHSERGLSPIYPSTPVSTPARRPPPEAGSGQPGAPTMGGLRPAPPEAARPPGSSGHKIKRRPVLASDSAVENPQPDSRPSAEASDLH